MNIYKKWILYVLLLPLPLVIALLALLYVYDPYQLFHKPYFREETFFWDRRIHNKGIINYYNFDSFILGTSILENTSSQEANHKLGGKWVNLSMSGSSFNERAVILDYLLPKNKAKQIIYSFDIHFVTTQKLKKDTSTFDFFYNDNPLDDFSVYLTQKWLKCALRFSKKENCVGKRGIDSVIQWSLETNVMNKFGGLQNWIKYYPKTAGNEYGDIRIFDMFLHSNPILNNQTTNIDDNLNYLNKFLLTYIKNSQNVEFHIIIPTYFRLAYTINNTNSLNLNPNNTLFYKYKKAIKWLILETQKYKNIKIYGFDTLDYADDIKNYKDVWHYNTDMNSMQLDAIKNGTHILTPQNMDEYFKIMEEKIRNYDLKPLVEQIKKAQKET